MSEPQVELPFVAESDTSRAAALRMQRARKVDDDRAAILAAIKRVGPAGKTDRELQDQLGLSGDSERPRRNELAGNGIISKSHPIWPVLIQKSGAKRDGGAVWVAC